MFYLVILVVSFLATLSVASPFASPVARQMPCALNVTKFTMFAVSKTNSTDQQQVVLGANTPDTHAAVNPLLRSDTAFKVFASTFNLTNGGMFAIATDGSVAGISNAVPTQNGALQFNVPVHNSNPGTPDKLYCEEFNTTFPGGATGVLALTGDSDDFSLCDDSASDAILLIFKPQEAGSVDSVFDFETCVAVDITIVPV
ncbi:hypothetical protein EI94DRAFT_1729875, partial [Lactarius quietus]